jgi:ribosomal protein S3AE
LGRRPVEEIVVRHLRDQIPDLTDDEEERHKELILRLVMIYGREELKRLRERVRDEILDFVRSSRREYGRYIR